LKTPKGAVRRYELKGRQYNNKKKKGQRNKQ